MNRLAKLLRNLRQTPGNSELAQEILTQAIIKVLQSQRLLGEILLQVPRIVVSDQEAIFNLVWQNNRLVLKVSSDLAHLQSDEVMVLLEHEALHILWMHPLRYMDSSTPDLVQLATDTAVNQYLPEIPDGTMTIGQLQKLLHQKIVPHQYSSVYLHLLQGLTVKEKNKLKRVGQRSDPHLTAAKVTRKITQETHQGWQTNQADLQVGNQQMRLAQVKQLLRHAWANTPKKDRGLLPGEVVAALHEGQVLTHQIDWHQLIGRQVGTVAAGREEVAYRFSRRQPWRMELPGTVSRLVPQVLVFVDNSGSVTDDELNLVLSEINQLAKNDQLPVEIYPFDARVHAENRQRVNNGSRVKFQRVGGGGTSFQCIFDFLHQQHINPTNSLVLIITDSWGEKEVNSYHYQRVDWIITGPITDLSVHRPVGYVASLKRGRE